MPVIIDELESVVEAPASPAPQSAPCGEGEAQASTRTELARTLRRMARRESRLAAD